MGPEKEKQEENKPVAMPHREDQTGIGQANQSTWGEGEVGKVIAPPPDAIPGKNLERGEKK